MFNILLDLDRGTMNNESFLCYNYNSIAGMGNTFQVKIYFEACFGVFVVVDYYFTEKKIKIVRM